LRFFRRLIRFFLSTCGYNDQKKPENISHQVFIKNSADI
jgi:hypothetical protein